MSEEKPRMPDGVWLTIAADLKAIDHRGRNLDWPDSAIKAHVRHAWRESLYGQTATDDDLQDAIDKMRHAKSKEDAKPRTDQALLVRGDSIEPEKIGWVWEGHLARGKLHLLAGAPSAGKTTIALAIAAAVTCGGKFPDNSDATPGDAVMWSGEDGIADTVVPRSIAMGADMSHLHFVKGITTSNGTSAFDPARDMDLLSTALKSCPEARLLIVDPVVSMVAGDSNQTNIVRRSLQPLVDLAERHHIAVLGITHLSKGTQGRDPVERVTGSVAFGALARVILFAARQQEQEGDRRPRLLLRVKSNIGPDGGGYEYHLNLAPVPGYPDIAAVSTVLWGEAVSGTARELLADAEANDEEALTGPQRCLLELLRGGSMHSKDLYAAAADRGYSVDQMKRAKDGINKRQPGRVMAAKATTKDGKPSKDGGWDWTLSEQAARRGKGF